MQYTPGQVGRGDVAIEYRDARFAELDAQIQAERANLQLKPAARKRKGQRTRPALPREMRKEITRCAQQLRQHRKLFMAHPKLRDRASRFLRSLLPPHKRLGRPGIPSVSAAISAADVQWTDALYPLAQEAMRRGYYMPNRNSIHCSRHQCPCWRRCEQDFGGVVEP